MKLTETENLKPQHTNNIQINTTQINKIHNSDKNLSEKITEILNIHKKNPNFKGKPSFKNGVTIAEDMDIALLNADKNNKTAKLIHRSTKNQRNHFINT